MKTPVMVEVQMGQDYPAHLLGRYPQVAHSGPDLLLRAHRDPHVAPEVRVPPGEVAWLQHPSVYAGVDHDHALRVVDDPAPDRHHPRLHRVYPHSLLLPTSTAISGASMIYVTRHLY